MRNELKNHDMPSWTFSDLIDLYADFLIVSIHNILYDRGLYPKESFVLARRYNYAVRKSRHPDVCEWVSNAVASSLQLIRKGEVTKLSLVVLSSVDVPLERFVYDVTSVPQMTTRDHDILFKDAVFTLEDIEQQYRACLMKISHVSEIIGKLPDGCTFTIIIELKDGATAPSESDSLWIPANGEVLQKENREGVLQPKVTPLRSINMGPLIFDMRIEESIAKGKIPESR
ncbi:DNA-binding protein [Dipodascopsis uninucleata]